MRVSRSALVLLTAMSLVTGACVPVHADSVRGERDHGWSRHRDHDRVSEYKESYREGPCKVEREQKRDGSYKEERECKRAQDEPSRHRGGEYEERYSEGPCKIEREWKRDGSYKEKLECKGYGQ
jgi:hypothetical protein